MNTNCWDNVMFDNASLDNSIGLIILLNNSEDLTTIIDEQKKHDLKGTLICVEGIDGSGKSTLAKAIMKLVNSKSGDQFDNFSYNLYNISIIR